MNLAQQEPIVQQTVDMWIEKLGELGTTENGIDMSAWLPPSIRYPWRDGF